MSILKLKSGNNILKRTLPTTPTIGNGLKFDGVNDYVENALFTLDYSTDWSFSIILKKLNVNSIYYFSIGNNTDRIQFDGANMRLLFTDNNTNLFSVNSGITLVVNELTHITATKSNTEVKFYKNGALFSTIALINPVSNICTKIAIGTDSSRLFCSNQKVWDFKFFDKTLTPSEVLTLFNTNNFLVPSNVRINYTFNQKNTPILIGAVLDSSGNGFHGDLVNYATPSDVTLGSTNSWVDENGNPILV
jgi:hypothetical protein